METPTAQTPTQQLAMAVLKEPRSPRHSLALPMGPLEGGFPNKGPKGEDARRLNRE